jgi:hypothetical protein
MQLDQLDHDQRPSADDQGGGAPTLKLLAYAIAGLLLARLPLLSRCAFDPDELEHAHAAWLMSRGMLPYRDFFEHHTPWYYYLLRPLFRFFDVDGSFEGGRLFLVAGRGLSLVLTAVAIVLLVRAASRWADRRVGLLAGLLLVAQPIFLQKTLEMRPDVPAVVFFIAGLGLLVRGLRVSRAPNAPVLRFFFGGGLGLGAAVMCTQKMLFVLPGVLAGLALWSLFATTGSVGARLRASVVVLLGVALPGIGTWAVFAAYGAGGAFITNNFLLNARWKHTPTHQFVRLLTGSWPVLALAVLGAWRALARFFQSAERRWEDVLLLAVMGGLFAGVAVVPSAHRQYYLMLLPIVCLYAADGLWALAGRALGRGPVPPARAAALALGLVPLALLPALALGGAYRSENGVQLARLRHVYDSTRPTDLVMDGWQGMGVFRPHAFRYFFLHEETRAMLPPAEWDAYLAALESGETRPSLIALDDNLRALGPRFLTFVGDHYVSRDGFFYTPSPLLAAGR